MSGTNDGRCDGGDYHESNAEEILDVGAEETSTIQTLPRGLWAFFGESLSLSPIHRHHCHSSVVIITIGATPRSYKRPHAKLDVDIAHMALKKADSQFTQCSQKCLCQMGFFFVRTIYFCPSRRIYYEAMRHYEHIH